MPALLVGSGVATAAGSASFSGSAAIAGVGVATATGTAFYTGSGSSVGAGKATVVDVDLLAALVSFLATDPALRTALDDGAGGMRIYTDVAPPAVAMPYIVIEDYSEDASGESLDDLHVPLTIVAYHKELDLVRGLANLVRRALDTRSITGRATRTEPLAWAGGRETGLQRRASRPRRIRGMIGGHYTWFESIGYEFWLTTDVTADA
jgi:hypothetical protein